MKKKILTFLFAICLILPCVLMLTACNTVEPTFKGYKVYINGTETNVFSCTIGETAITAQNISVKSDWSDESLNTEFSLDDFDISVEWREGWGEPQTTFPDFWTNGTGNTTNDYVATYEFKLTLKSDNFWTVTFSVEILPIIVSNLRVRIFDGTDYAYNAEMVWGHNERESDPTKHFSFDIENLDASYDQQEHIQWAVIEKETYDALETQEQKKAFMQFYEHFSTGQIYEHYEQGTYYVFAYVPGWNNYRYGTYGDGFIFDYAVLTIKPIEMIQTAQTHELSHDYQYKPNDFKYIHIDTNSEITANIDYDYSSFIQTEPYAYIDGNWTMIETYDDFDGFTSIKVNAILTDNGYQLVDLKNIETSLHEWVFINDDGSQGDVVTDNSAIVLVDYKELALYKNVKDITIPTYYMLSNNTSSYVQFDFSQLYRTEVKINKYVVNVVPGVDVGSGDANTNKFITGPNRFEFTYGVQVQVGTNEIWGIEQIILNALSNAYSKCYYFAGLHRTEPSDEPYYAYIVLNNPHFTWKLDGVNYTTDSIEIMYYIHPAE
ncbi:MAG: hypothetical protein J6V66_02065 [Clostridia bacterium]|nr:hypothetical protein [Clostridia bacterium]